MQMEELPKFSEAFLDGRNGDTEDVCHVCDVFKDIIGPVKRSGREGGAGQVERDRETGDNSPTS
jgi:hypothetical protein